MKTKDLNSQILDLHRENKTVQEICKILNCHNNSVYQTLYKHGLCANTKKRFLSDLKLTDDLIEKIKDMRENKKTREEISVS